MVKMRTARGVIWRDLMAGTEALMLAERLYSQATSRADLRACLHASRTHSRCRQDDLIARVGITEGDGGRSNEAQRRDHRANERAGLSAYRRACLAAY